MGNAAPAAEASSSDYCNVVPDISPFNLPPSIDARIGFKDLLYQEAWGILICGLCLDGVKPNTRSLKEHFTSTHDYNLKDLPNFNKVLEPLNIDTGLRVVGVRDTTGRLPRPIPQLEVIAINVCETCGYSSRSIEIAQVIAHQKATGHKGITMTHGQTIYGNCQYRKHLNLKGKTAFLFPVETATSTVAPPAPPREVQKAAPKAKSSVNSTLRRTSIPNAVSPDVLPARSFGSSPSAYITASSEAPHTSSDSAPELTSDELLLLGFQQTLDHCSADRSNEPSFRDIRVSLQRLGWYEKIKDITEQAIIDLTRAPMDDIVTHHIPVEVCLARLPPLVHATFESLYQKTRASASYLRNSAFNIDHKNISVIQAPTRKQHAREWIRFLAFVLRHDDAKYLIPTALAYTPLASRCIQQLKNHLSASENTQSPEDLVRMLTFEIFFGKEFSGVSDSSKWAIFWYLPMSSTKRGTFDKPTNIVPRLQGLDYCARLVLLSTQDDHISSSSSNLDPGPLIQSIVDETRKFLTDTACSYRQVEFASQHIQTEAKGQLMLPNTDWKDTTGQVLMIRNKPLKLEDISQAAILALDHAYTVLFTKLMFGQEWSRPKTSLVDDHGNIDVGYSFVTEKENKFTAGSSTLIRYILSNEDLKSSFGFVTAANGPVGNAAQIRQYLIHGETFRKHLAVAIHLTGGGTMRGTELSTIKIVNTSTSLRDLYYACGSMCIAPGFNKTDSLTGKQMIRPRLLTPALAELVIQYLVLVRPFELALDNMVRPNQGQRRLSTHLFVENGSECSTNWLTAQLGRHFGAIGAHPFGVSDYRHAYTAFGRYHIGKAFQDIDTQDTEDQVFDLQTGHTTATANAVYARDKSVRTGMTANELLEYCRVSQRWAEVLGVHSYQPKQVGAFPAAAAPISACDDPSDPECPPPIVLQPMASTVAAPVATRKSRSPGNTPPAKRNRGAVDQSAVQAPAATSQSISDSQSPRLGSNGTTLVNSHPPSTANSKYERPAVIPDVFEVEEILEEAFPDSSVPFHYYYPDMIVVPSSPSIEDLSEERNSEPSTPIRQIQSVIDKEIDDVEHAIEVEEDISHSGTGSVPSQRDQLPPSSYPGSPAKSPSPAKATEAAVDDVFGPINVVISKDTIKQGLRSMSSNYTGLRIGQSMCIKRVYRSLASHPRTDSMVILPTGAGKTLVYAVQYFLPGYTGLTIILAPTVALKNDLVRRFQDWRIPVAEWSADIVMRKGFVVVGSDSVSSQSFMKWSERSGTLITHVVVEEAHLTLSSSDYRPALSKIQDLRAVTTSAAWTLVTATAPPKNAGLLLDAHGVDRLLAIRLPNIRPTHRFSVYPKTWERLDKPCIRALQELYYHLQENWLSPDGQVLVFSPTRAMVHTISEALGCPAFSRNKGGQEEDKELDRIMGIQRDRFINGEHPLAVSTSLLSVGVDIPNLEVIIHVGNPNDLGDYLQEVGRCGRTLESSKLALSILMKVDTRLPTKLKHDRGVKQLDQFSSSTINCRRSPLAEYNDGLLVDCLSLPSGALCDLCLLNDGKSVEWLPRDVQRHPIRRNLCHVDPVFELVAISEKVVAKTPAQYHGTGIPIIDISPEIPYPPPPSAHGDRCLADQVIYAIRMLYERGQAFQRRNATKSRVQQAQIRWSLRDAQSKCTDIIHPIGRTCVACFASQFMPGARSCDTNHIEDKCCPSLREYMFTSSKMPAFRKSLKAGIRVTGKHCASCLVPFEPCPSELHGEPNAQGGSCKTSQNNHPSTSDCQITVLYALIYGFVDGETRPQAIYMSEVEAVKALSSVGVSGCLVAAELMGWLRQIPCFQED